jgi:hypothetical protein
MNRCFKSQQKLCKDSQWYAYLVRLVVLVMKSNPAAIAILVLLAILETITDAHNPVA